MSRTMVDGRQQRRMSIGDFERLLLAVRVNVALVAAVGDSTIQPGNRSAIVAFPVHVVDGRPAGWGDQNARNRVERSAPRVAYPVTVSVEPGLFPTGTTRVDVHVKTARNEVRGWFTVTVDKATAATGHHYDAVRGPGCAEIIGQLPGEQTVAAPGYRFLRREVAKWSTDSQYAIADLIQYGGGMVRSLFHQKFAPHISRVLSTADEVLSVGDEFVWKSVLLFASPGRPAHTWARHLQLSLPRDMNRAAWQYDPEKEDTRDCRSAIDKLRHLTNDPAEMFRALAIEKTVRDLKRTQPNLSDADTETEVERLAAAGQLSYRYSEKQVREVMESPAMAAISLDQPLHDDGAPIADVIAISRDNELDMVVEAGLFGAVDQLLNGRDDIDRDHFIEFLHAYGLTTGTDDVVRPRALPVNGPIGTEIRRLFSPFLGPDESWAKAEHREHARARCREQLTRHGALKSADEIVTTWQTVLGDRRTA